MFGEKFKIDRARARADFPQGQFQIRCLAFGEGNIPQNCFDIACRRVRNIIPAAISLDEMLERAPRYLVISPATDEGTNELAGGIPALFGANPVENSAQATPDELEVSLSLKKLKLPHETHKNK